MKRLILILGFFAGFLLIGPAMGSPFFVCSPQADAAYFQIEVDGVIYLADTMGTAGTDLRISHDIAGLGLSDGAHQARARACNSDHFCSDWSPFLSFDSIPSSNTSGFGLSALP